MKKTLVCAAVIAWGLAGGAVAANLTWDPSYTGGSDGSGAWDTTTTNWWDGVNDTNWTGANPDSAIFGAVGGTGVVSLVGAITVSNITFADSYLIQSNTLTLSSASAVTVNSNATISSVLAGGSLVKTGAGTLTLSGANSYSGGTTINAGTLQLGNGGTGGAMGTNAVLDNASLVYNQSAVTVGNAISGTGTVSGTTSGALTIAGDITMTGGGSFNLASTNNALTMNGTRTLSVVNGNGVLSAIENGSSVMNLSGVITLTASGTGSLSLTGTSTHSGGGGYTGADLGGSTLITSGTINLNGFNSGDQVGLRYISSAGTIDALSGTTTLKGKVAGSSVNTALFQFQSAGTVTFAASAGAAIVLQADSTSTAGGISFRDFTTDPTFNISGNVSFLGRTVNTGTFWSGSPTFNVATGGVLTLNGNGDTLGNGITVNETNAAVTVAGSGSGTMTGAFALTGGTLIYNISGAGSLTHSGIISGTGALTKSGSGTVALAGANTYTGATTISNGVLQIGAGGTVGTLGSGAVIDNATLVFDRSDARTNSTAISGTGVVVQAGTGILTLAGTNTFTGSVLVTNGTLVVAGNSSGGAFYTVTNTAALIVTGSTGTGAVSIATGCSLADNGTVGSALALAPGSFMTGGGTNSGAVTSGGTISPGTSNSIGSLTFGSDYTQADNGVLSIRIASASNDEIYVTGTSSLGGTLTVAFTNGFVPTMTQSWQIVTAGTLSGVFATTNLPALAAGLSWNVAYTNNAVLLSIVGAPLPMLVSPFNLNFGGVSTGQTATLSFVMTNTSASVTFTGTASVVTGSPTFSIVTGSTFSLAPSTSTNISMSFSPLATGGFTGSVAFASDLGGTVTNMVTGSGVSQNLLWDPAATNGASDGSGTWDLTTLAWWGGLVTPWVNGLNATFGNGGAAGTVSLAVPVTVSNIIFNAGYTVQNSTLALASPSTVTTLSNAVINSTLASGSLVKAGGAALTLGGTNTYGGGTTISAGTLDANISQALGATTNTLTLGDAGSGTNAIEMEVDSGITAHVLLAAINTTSNGSSQTILLNSGSALGGNMDALNAKVNLNGNLPLTIQASNTGGHVTAQDISCQLFGSGVSAGNTALICDGTSALLRLSFGNTYPPNSFSGDVVIKGTVVSQDATYAGNTAANQNIGFTNNNMMISAGATWQTGWGSETVGALNGSGNVALNAQIALNNIGLTLGNNEATGLYSGVISGGWGVAKIGPGIQVFSGTNTYTGVTDVSNGELVVNGVVGGSGVSVSASGATLAGMGVITAPVTSDGIVAPGGTNGLGTLTISNNYTQASDGTLALNIAGPSSSAVLHVSSTALLGGALKVAFTNGYVPATTQSWQVVTAGTLSGSFATTNLPSLGAGLQWSVSTSNNIYTLSLVPALSGYNAWAATITNGMTGYNQSATGDGYANLLKYATGSNPTQSDSLASVGGMLTNGLPDFTFNWNTNATDVTLIVEGSFSATDGATWVGITTNADGAGWNPTNGVTVTGTGATNPVSVSVTDPYAGSTNRFLRLRVTIP